MDMDSLLGSILGTVVNYDKDPYVHCSGSLIKANTDSGSCKP